MNLMMQVALQAFLLLGGSPLLLLINGSANIGVSMLKKQYEHKRNRRLEPPIGSEHNNEPEIDVISDPNMSDSQKIVIIGAGWAGISAAKFLLKEGHKNFIVLEARDYIGGRSQTIEVNETEINTGAAWLMDYKCNPLLAIAKRANATLVEYEDRWSLWDENGQQIEDAKLDSDMDNILYGAWQNSWYGHSYIVNKNDEPLANITSAVAESLDSYGRTGARKFLTALLEAFYEIPYGASLEELSLWYSDAGEYLCGEYSPWKYISSGVSHIVDQFVTEAGIRKYISTNSVVSKINTEGKDTIVTFTNETGSHEISAKKVIVTVPLGVLKAEKIEFVPKLPKQKQEAIDKLGMGKQLRLYMFWEHEDEIFWPEEPDALVDMNSAMRGDKIDFLVPSSVRNTTKPLLVAKMTSLKARDLEAEYADENITMEQYKEELVKLAMRPLKTMFGENATEPTNVHVTDWNIDEFSYGVYSYYKVGSGPWMRDRLRYSVDNKIHFSGEATSRNWYGTMHGAAIEGKKVARRVLKRSFPISTKSKIVQ